ncbi:ubiquitin 3 binding protein But2 C-terminal domain-containing protein [Aspergillus carlsbadensis]|nr:ubiquitin 3 binding protein But2 C-terminal domain-containing protein [Aspergillus carlsbadensis]
MRNFATFAAFAASANALVPRDTSCCFGLTASGEASGPVGQLDDGQNRIGGDLPAGQYCIDSDGSITDGNGRGCILTPPTTQFQCDEGASPSPGFSVNSNGQLEYDGSTDFVACETGQNGGLNIYTTESDAVTNCRTVQLIADSCSGSGTGTGSSSVPGGGGGQSSSAPQPSPTVPVVSPSPSAPGSEGPGGGGGSATSPVVSPSSTSPGEGPGGGGGGEGGSTVTPSPTSPGEGTDCSLCETTTVLTTVIVPCSSETPGVPIPGESTTPGVPGGESPTPSGPGETQPPSTETPVVPGESGTPGVPGGESPTPSGPGETSPPQTSQPPQPQPSGECCQTDLSGDYEFPHLIVPVDSSSPDEAVGTSFNGTVSSTVSTIFNFDIPASDAGRTCSLVFLFPKQEDLETSAFSFSGDGKVTFGAVSEPATQSTTFNNAPSISENLGDFTISPGHSYAISTFECPAGQTVGYEITNSGSTSFEFFEDYNPSPLGLYITKC